MLDHQHHTKFETDARSPAVGAVKADSIAHGDARIRRKLDRHMMPLFFVLYMLAFLDRGNIGNAQVAGMGKDLHLTSSQYAWFATIFYITYIVFEFSLLFWKLYPPHLVGAVVVFGWSVCAESPVALLFSSDLSLSVLFTPPLFTPFSSNSIQRPGASWARSRPQRRIGKA